jgi:hypothetical protein
VARRQELQRLLGAAVVKAGASGRADDPRVRLLADEAQRALLVPCDIDRAENTVDAYIDALRRKPLTGTPGLGGTSGLSGAPGLGGAPALGGVIGGAPGVPERREMSA